MKTKKLKFFDSLEKNNWIESYVCGEKFLFHRRSINEVNDFIAAYAEAEDKAKFMGDFMVNNICDENKQVVFTIEDFDNMPIGVCRSFSDTLFRINGIGDEYKPGDVAKN